MVGNESMEAHEIRSHALYEAAGSALASPFSGCRREIGEEDGVFATTDHISPTAQLHKIVPQLDMKLH